VSETTVKGSSISIIVGRLLIVVGVAISFRDSFTGTPLFASLSWTAGTESYIAIGMTLFGLAILTQDNLTGWVVAFIGVTILVGAATHGNLYGSGRTYEPGVVIANTLAVAYVGMGLYFALRKSQGIR
jgi:hypothetical protein